MYAKIVARNMVDDDNPSFGRLSSVIPAASRFATPEFGAPKRSSVSARNANNATMRLSYGKRQRTPVHTTSKDSYCKQ